MSKPKPDPLEDNKKEFEVFREYWKKIENSGRMPVLKGQITVCEIDEVFCERINQLNKEAILSLGLPPAAFECKIPSKYITHK